MTDLLDSIILVLDGGIQRAIPRQNAGFYAICRPGHERLEPLDIVDTQPVPWITDHPAVPREVARFLQSRLGELSVAESRYEDLLSEADAAYPRYLTALRARLGP